MITFFENENGPIRIFKKPEVGRLYTLGIDASTGLANDNTGMQVLTNTIPFEQVARFKGRFPVNQVSEIANHLGRYYNEAMIICEVNYPGNSVQDQLLSFWKYPRNYQPETHLQEEFNISAKYGFRTTETTKWLIISEMLLASENREIIVHDSDTLAEINNFVYAEAKRKAGGAPGFTDDLVMSLLLALHGAKLYPQVIYKKQKTPKHETKDPDTKRDWRLFRRKLYNREEEKQGVVL